MNRLAKQVIYSLFFLVVIAIIIGIFYFIFSRNKPNCFDRIQNQGELGVDCGSVCGNNCLPTEFKPVQVSDVWIIGVDSNHISILAKIENPNQNVAAKNFNYEFSVKDENGQVKNTILGSDFIFAGEIKYILKANISAKFFLSDYGELTIRNPKWVSGQDFLKPQLNIQNTDVSISDSKIKLTGIVVNSDNLKISSIKIISIFYTNNSFRPLGASETEISNLTPGSSNPFVIYHPIITSADLSRTKTFAFGFW